MQNTYFIYDPRSRKRHEFSLRGTLSTGGLSGAHKRLTPELRDAFQTFNRKVFGNGALATKTKQLIGSDRGGSRNARRHRLCALRAGLGRIEKASASLVSDDAIAAER
jgi:hypothetical protein